MLVNVYKIYYWSYATIQTHKTEGITFTQVDTVQLQLRKISVNYILILRVVNMSKL
jgi:hypothetical protein